MTRRMQGNLSSLQPEEVWKSWMMWGGQAQEQFRNIVATATRAAAAGPPTGTDRDR
jgi:phage terminase large subunit-like protein